MQDKPLSLAPHYHAIRTPVSDEGAIHHVAGQSAFLDDLPDLAGTLHIAVGVSSVARGRIARLDLGAVEAAADVVFALTAKDVPGLNDASPTRTDDHPILAQAEIEYCGQPIFAVVARSHAAAKAALAAAQVAITPSLPTTELDEALATHATLLADYGLERGDPTDEIRRCDRKLFGQLRAAGQDHHALEPHGALAVLTEGGRIEIVASTEAPATAQEIVSEMLDVPANAVTVTTRRVGAGFGGRHAQSAQWAAIAALAAWRSGRPCKLRLDHDVAMNAGGKRQDLKIDYAAGFSESGRLVAVEATFATRAGSGVDLSVESNDQIVLSADNAYYLPALRLLSRRMRTNTPPGTWWRGAGSLEGVWFAERLMDHIAAATGADPLDVRKENLYGAGREYAPSGSVIEGRALGQLVAELERTSEYRRRRRDVARFNQSSPILKRGLALSPVKVGVGRPPAVGNAASCLIRIEADGTVRLVLSAVEAGQGIATRAMQVVAEEFGIRHQSVRIMPTSTAVTTTPGTPGADATLLAVIDGCQALKDRIYDFVEATMQVDRERVAFRDGRVRLGGRHLDFTELVASVLAGHVPLEATGYYANTAIDWDRSRAAGQPFHYYVFGAACAEVTVDIMTGEHRLERVDVLQDAGRSLNPAIDLGLIEGGFALGLGWLTTEELVRDSAGKLRSLGADYEVPHASDIPSDFRVAFHQSAGAREDTPYRSKDIEDATLPLAVSVFCAISDAIRSLKPGTLPRLNAPATPENVMRAVRALADGE